jgi:hypothetical protein
MLRRHDIRQVAMAGGVGAYIGGRRLVKVKVNVKAGDGRWSQPESENQDIKSL